MSTRYAWYAAYASNLLERRFLLYITGGRLAENGRDHAGARDRTLPQVIKPLVLPGTMYFATESTTWGGGRALYDADAFGPTLARGYLLTEAQLLDVVAQEMRLTPGIYNPGVLPREPGTSTALGGGHYETLACTGSEAGCPVYTMAAPWGMDGAELLPPAPAYRDLITEGLAEAWSFTPAEAREYLDELPGSAIMEESHHA